MILRRVALHAAVAARRAATEDLKELISVGHASRLFSSLPEDISKVAQAARFPARRTVPTPTSAAAAAAAAATAEPQAASAATSSAATLSAQQEGAKIGGCYLATDPLTNETGCT
jgi:hypothetical protein